MDRAKAYVRPVQPLSPPSLLTSLDHPFDRITEQELRARQSAKWKLYPDDVLPLWVAEMDYPIADPIKRVLHAAIDADDAGYADPRGLGEAFVSWARARWGWELVPADVRVAPDVVTAITELLLVTTNQGDGVVIDPPVYPPFASTIRRLGRKVVEAPMASSSWPSSPARLNLDAIERAYAGGARVHLLCSPHNPLGTVHAREDLAHVAELAAKHDVLVLADEIHAPMTYAEHVHVPFPTVSANAARTSIVLTSASKTFNLAGLKASVMIASHDVTRAVLNRTPMELPYHAGHLGVLGARAAFAEGVPWLTSTMAILDRNRHLLAELLAKHIPLAKYRPPGAGYLAWVDLRALPSLGIDPAKRFLDEARVALSQGPTFGTGGDGFARVNLATTRSILEEAVSRMGKVARSG